MNPPGSNTLVVCLFAARTIVEIGKLVGDWLKSSDTTMKRHGHLWDQVISFEALLRAAELACTASDWRGEAGSVWAASEAQNRQP